MLAGQTEVHGGELAFAKGTRIALHDQRPPLQRGMTLREYVLSGASDLIAIEDELRRLEEAMAAGDHGPQTLAATPRRRRGSSTPAATPGATASAPSRAASASARSTSTACSTPSPAAS